MKLTIEKTSLFDALVFAKEVADRRSTMPILANVLLRTEAGGKLLIAATDLNLTVTAEVEAQVLEPGGLTLGARHLHEIVKALPSGIVSLRRADNQYAEVRAGKVEYKVVGMADRDFPKLPSVDGVKFATIKADVLAGLIERSAFACSTDETRHHLNGALLRAEKASVAMVATDGHRLSLARSQAEWSLDAPKTSGEILIPRKGLARLRGLLEGKTEVELGVAPKSGHLFCRAGAVLLAIKLIEAQFPPFENVIPKAPSRCVTVSRLALIQAIHRVSIMSSDKTLGVRFSGGDGAMRIEADNPDLGEGREELDIEYTGAGAFRIAANARYMLDALGAIEGEKVQLQVDGGLEPIKIVPAEGDGYVGVVMPMRD